jgi:hypothetical protein
MLFEGGGLRALRDLASFYGNPERREEESSQVESLGEVSLIYTNTAGVFYRPSRHSLKLLRGACPFVRCATRFHRRLAPLA